MCYCARTSVDRILMIIPPVAAFVAAGFEHSIANIYFISIGLYTHARAPLPAATVRRGHQRRFRREGQRRAKAGVCLF
jgi:formate/nitrite transporter FocA (FNT family)